MAAENRGLTSPLCPLRPLPASIHNPVILLSPDHTMNGTRKVTYLKKNFFFFFFPFLARLVVCQVSSLSVETTGLHETCLKGLVRKGKTSAVEAAKTSPRNLTLTTQLVQVQCLNVGVTLCFGSEITKARSAPSHPARASSLINPAAAFAGPGATGDAGCAGTDSPDNKYLFIFLEVNSFTYLRHREPDSMFLICGAIKL